MSKKKTSKRQIRLEEVKHTQKEIRKVLKSANEALSIRQLKRKIDAATMPHIFNDALDYLRARGEVKELKDGRLAFSEADKMEKGRYVTGTIDMTATGNAYLLSPEMDSDVFISRGNLNKAFDGDQVKVELTKIRGKKPEGKVREIIQRHQREIVGTVQMGKGFAFVVPDHRKVPIDIFVPPAKLGKAKEGDRVIVRIVEWNENMKNPQGEIVENLGHLGENDAEMKSILVESGFPLQFSQAVMKEADRIGMDIPKEEIARRRDFREITTFTIDPDDAKDFDDALSIRQLDNGHYEVGVHIADVSHYIRPGSALEKEAVRRSTSVYMVDRVLPMLPEKLSNMVCSLRPNEEKLCYAAVFELDDQARIHKRWFGRTVIRSDRRFTYDEVQQIIDGKDGDFKKEILTLNTLSQVLRKEKFKNGAIAFETVEFKFILDIDGVPLDVIPKERKEAHMLIEDFMLLANREVAQYVGKPRANKKVRPFVYRIHDQPNPEKLADFARTAKTFGYDFKYDTPRVAAESLNKLMKAIKGKPEQDILEKLAIRSMAKAIYTTKNIGHYGLGFEYYTHFTSPIRRYPDIMVHRLLDDELHKRKASDQDELEAKCRHSSWMEVKAVEAERESVKYKQVQFMMNKVGEEFDGIISGVVAFGLFIELLDSRAEGLVDIDSLRHDFFVYNESNHALIGSETGIMYRLGDKVRVKVVKADLERRRLDFELVAPL